MSVLWKIEWGTLMESCLANSETSTYETLRKVKNHRTLRHCMTHFFLRNRILLHFCPLLILLRYTRTGPISLLNFVLEYKCWHEIFFESVDSFRPSLQQKSIRKIEISIHQWFTVLFSPKNSRYRYLIFAINFDICTRTESSVIIPIRRIFMQLFRMISAINTQQLALSHV